MGSDVESSESRIDCSWSRLESAACVLLSSSSANRLRQDFHFSTSGGAESSPEAIRPLSGMATLTLSEDRVKRVDSAKEKSDKYTSSWSNDSYKETGTASDFSNTQTRSSTSLWSCRATTDRHTEGKL